MSFYKRFNKWCDYDYFFELWKDIVKTYQNEKLQADSRWFENLLIDSTMIKNFSGVESLGSIYYL